MKLKEKKKILAVVLAAALIFDAGCSIFNKSTSTQNMQTHNMTLPVTKGTINSTIDLVGNAAYSQSASLTWKTSGVIETVKVKNGDTVQKGDILATLETDSLPSSVILAEKTLLDAQDNLENVMNSTTAKMTSYQSLNSTQTALQSTKEAQESLYYSRSDTLTKQMAYDTYELSVINFNYAKADYDQIKKQNEFGTDARNNAYSNYVSKYDAMVTAYEDFTWLNGSPTDLDYIVANGDVKAAQAAYDSALSDYETYETMPRTKDVVAAQAEEDSAKNTYNKRNIIAPFSGTITSVSAEEGHYVVTDDVAFEIDNMDRVFVPISISEIDISKVYKGQKAIVTFDAVSGTKYDADVYSISDYGEETDSATSFETQIEITSPDDKIKAGMTAEVSLILQEYSDVLLVPMTAVSTENNQSYVTVSEDSGERTVPVTLGVSNSYVAEVKSGEIKEGDHVVVSSINDSIIQALGINMADLMGPNGMPGANGTSGPENNQMPSEMPENLKNEGTQPALSTNTAESNGSKLTASVTATPGPTAKNTASATVAKTVSVTETAAVTASPVDASQNEMMQGTRPAGGPPSGTMPAGGPPPGTFPSGGHGTKSNMGGTPAPSVTSASSAN